MKTSEWMKDFKKKYGNRTHGYCRFICLALKCDYRGAGMVERMAVVNRIEGLLRADCQTDMDRNTLNHHGIKGWLLIKGVPRTDLTDHNMRAYRLRFIDHLISLYESEGD